MQWKRIETINRELGKQVSQLENLSSILKKEIGNWQIEQQKLIDDKATIQRLAYFDHLTGLPNRAHFHRRLRQELESSLLGGNSGVVMFVDLDDLKLINDSFGHSRGDAIIILAGAYLLAEAGEAAFVARIGGDEFIVILPGKQDRKEIAAIADNIIQALYQEYEAFGERFQLSASIGITLYPVDGSSNDEIFKNADTAMYAAKKSGKNCWRFYEESMRKEAYERMRLMNSLRHVVERNELLLHYQPQIILDESGNQVVGFEALARWNSPEYGAVSPAQFIPLAEEGRSIGEIGKWVLNESCHFLRRLIDCGWKNLFVAVNISAHQLKSAEFLDLVLKVLTETGISPDQLEIEITESVLIDSLDEAIIKLNKLQNIGVHLSLDDFGTGYSSLTYLQRLPVQTIKIDKTFIDTIEQAGSPKAIIKTIVDLAHIMNMTVVAEGVETWRQMDYLCKCYCDKVQGYLISRPLPESDVFRFLQDYDSLSQKRRQNQWKNK